MSILGSLEASIFLSDYWQRRPYLFRRVWTQPEVWPDLDELSGLALEEAVDSRLITGSDGARDWQLTAGPFTETALMNLPECSWTLLVQGVDRWHPGVHALLDAFDFLPRWRLDDAMLSIAAEGGGVGPHVDQYDVFLLQTTGRRRWRIGAHLPGEAAPATNDGLALLAHFEVEEDHVLDAGDMLYLPAGFPHWGTALDAPCVTCSIGFRAPSAGELAQATAAEFASQLSGSRRFADPLREIPTDPHRIDRDDVATAIEVSGLGFGHAQLEACHWRAGALALGKLVTLPYESPEPPVSVAAVSALLEAPEQLVAAPESRFAYCDLQEHGAWLFVDGEAFELPAASGAAICHGHITPGVLSDQATRRTVRTLVAEGSLLSGLGT